MATTQNKKWALDTNIILDLGRKIDAALTLCEIGAERGYALYATPTVIKEVFHLATDGSGELRRIAEFSLRKFSSFGIQPLTLDSSAETIALEFSKFLRENRALPEGK